MRYADEVMDKFILGIIKETQIIVFEFHSF